MTTTAAPTTAPTAPVKAAMLRMAVARPLGEPDEHGYRDDFVTRVGRGFGHDQAEGFNIIFDQTPVLTGDARLLLFAGPRGAKFPDTAPPKVGIFEVTPYTDAKGVKRKQWNRLGTAVLSSGRGNYVLLLNALPGNGKATCIVPSKRTPNGAPEDGEAAPDTAQPAVPDAAPDTAPF